MLTLYYMPYEFSLNLLRVQDFPTQQVFTYLTENGQACHFPNTNLTLTKRDTFTSTSFPSRENFKINRN